MGLFFKRANTTGALASIAVGFGITAWLIGLQLTGSTLVLPNFLYVAFWHFVICCGTLYGFSLLGKNKPDSELARVVWSVQEFNDETAELKTIPWYQNFRYQGLILLAVITIILLIF
jgi:SSS family solute:Na+ symporter